ncbi:hypothetical protein FGADI_1704 [Fusarium gaditjirri]|uniref:Protein kinase domain-containing protein n=1 Tax=Fusarium gaditjirri TaxID=282569 RepID=A0A8H4TKB8_9HYPO|nr:hypothetical protein FGADI_1704 [Fusarium gaditjirri]
MDGSLSDLVRDYKLTTRYESAFTIHFHSDPDTPPSAPYRQERWKKLRTLGYGGQGDVILQACTDGSRSFTERAVKRIRLESEYSKQHYRRELESIFKFSHEKYSQYFVKSLGWYMSSNKLYIAMEFFPEGDLYAYVRDHQRLTEEECSHITSQVLSGVAIMHEEGFAHRDVKPQNILIHKPPRHLDPRSWWVKLADFGISKKLTSETTGTTLVPGTPLYMSPELLHFDSQSISTKDYRMADTWAIGITTFFILTKTVPFKSQLAVLHYTGSSDELTAGLTQHQVTENAQDFVCKLLKPRPGERLDAAEARQHTWIRHWLPEIPTAGAHSRPSTISSRRSSLQDETGVTTEISTLASQTVSQRWTGDFHDLGISPKAPEEIHNSSDNLIKVEEMELPIGEAKSITITEPLRPESMGTLMPNPQYCGISRDASILQQLYEWIGAGNIDRIRVLVHLGVDVNSLDSNGHTPLHLSITNGSVEITRLLCEGGAVIEKRNQSGCTPLHLAVMNGHTEAAAFLLGEGADIEASDSFGGITPLGFAASMNHPAVAKLLLNKGANVEAVDHDGCTPLLSAARSGSKAVSKLLLRHGAHIEATDESGRTPLIMAAVSGSKSVVNLLIRHGANVNAREYSGFTPLRISKIEGDDAVRKLLLKAGARVDASSPVLCRSLHEAARSGYNDTITVLLRQQGINIDYQDDFGHKPLILAAREGHVDTARLLIENGANREAVDHSHYTPLMAASDQGRTSMVTLLLQYNADVSASDLEGNTSMALASRKGHMGTVKCLCNHLVPVNKPNNSGETPLMWAANGGYLDVAKELIGAGADINANDIRGFTSLTMAARRGHGESVKFLLGRKAQLNSKSLDVSAALIEAAKGGHEAVVKILLEDGVTIEAMDASGDTALVHSVRRNHEAVVALLLQKGAYADAEDKYGVVCLMIAARNGNNVIMDLLVKHGAKERWRYHLARIP